MLKIIDEKGRFKGNFLKPNIIDFCVLIFFIFFVWSMIMWQHLLFNSQAQEMIRLKETNSKLIKESEKTVQGKVEKERQNWQRQGWVLGFEDGFKEGYKAGVMK